MDAAASGANIVVAPSASAARNAAASLGSTTTTRAPLLIGAAGSPSLAPENSLSSFSAAVNAGAGAILADVRLTADGVPVIIKDETIDRTTSGKGRVRDITYDSIRRCKLRRAHNVVTDSLRMPTLREALKVCKDRIVVNIDQGYEYYDLVLAITEELGVTEQILIKGKRAPEIVAAKFAEHPRNMMYMPIIDILKPKGQALFAEYREKGIVPLAYEICWDRPAPEVEACMREVVAGGSKLWVNSLWASLCGGLDDDRAFEGDPAAVYGKLVDMGATMIQTDRPELLISYLRSRGLHD